jgi:hypothetical protein
MKKFNKTIAVFLAFAMVLTLNPLNVNAKYKDKSGDLPGMTSDGTIIALAAVAAVGVGVLVYMLVKKSGQDKATGAMETYKTMEIISWENRILNLAKEHQSAVSTPQSNKTANLPAFSMMPQNTLAQQMENAKNTIPVDLVVAPLSNQTHFALGKTNGVQVGVRIRF